MRKMHIHSKFRISKLTQIDGGTVFAGHQILCGVNYGHRGWRVGGTTAKPKQTKKTDDN